MINRCHIMAGLAAAVPADAAKPSCLAVKAASRTLHDDVFAACRPKVLAR